MVGGLWGYCSTKYIPLFPATIKRCSCTFIDSIPQHVDQCVFSVFDMFCNEDKKSSEPCKPGHVILPPKRTSKPENGCTLLKDITKQG